MFARALAAAPAVATRRLRRRRARAGQRVHRRPDVDRIAGARPRRRERSRSCRSAAPSRTARTWRSASTTCASRRWRRRSRARSATRSSRRSSRTCPKAASIRRRRTCASPARSRVPDGDVRERARIRGAQPSRAAASATSCFIGDHGGYQRNEEAVARGSIASGRRAPVRVHALTEYYRVDRDAVSAGAESARLHRRRDRHARRRRRHVAGAGRSIPRLVRAAQLAADRRSTRRTASTATRAARRREAGAAGVDAHRPRSVAAIRRVPRGADTLFHPLSRNSRVLRLRSPVSRLALRMRVHRCSLTRSAGTSPASTAAAAATQAAPPRRQSRRCPACRPSSTRPTCTAKRRAAQRQRRTRAALAARLRAERPVERRLRDRPGDAEGRRSSSRSASTRSTSSRRGT